MLYVKVKGWKRYVPELGWAAGFLLMFVCARGRFYQGEYPVAIIDGAVALWAYSKFRAAFAVRKAPPRPTKEAY